LDSVPLSPGHAYAGGAPVKIAFVADYPASPDHVVGGVQACVRRLAAAMAARPSLSVHVVSCEPDLEEARVEEFEGVRIHRFRRPRHLGNVTLGWSERRETARQIARIAPDIVHAHVLGPGALGAADSGIPWVATAHGIQVAYGRLLKGWVGRARAWSLATMEEMCLKRARHLIVISPYVLESFNGLLRNVITHPIENPVEDRFFRLPPAASPREVLVSGRVVPQKGPEFLLEAAALLHAAGEDLRIRFAGPVKDAQYARQLSELARTRGIADRVFFLGSLSQSQLIEEMERAGLLVLPSLEETSSLAVMEAMAAGRPVVATSAGGNRHLVQDGATGWIVPPRSGRALAQAMAEAFADPAGARALGEKGRQTARARFGVGAIVDRTLEVYEDILAEERPLGEKSLDRALAND
jgi:glycosyltransferase involved in cell wall biosynthesis